MIKSDQKRKNDSKINKWTYYKPQALHNNSSFVDLLHNGVCVALQLLQIGLTPVPSPPVEHAAIDFLGLIVVVVLETVVGVIGGAALLVSGIGVIVAVGVVTDDEEAEDGGVVITWFWCCCWSLLSLRRDNGGWDNVLNIFKGIFLYTVCVNK